MGCNGPVRLSTLGMRWIDKARITIFFLEHAGELRIIILKEEETVLQRLRKPTQTHTLVQKE